MSITRRGVYFLANNKVYELAIAFLNSFRLYNKDIELCLIPFDDAYDEIAALKDDYNFSIFLNSNILQQCDQISTKFHDKRLGAYRKLCAWEGDFDEFIYIDLDTVVLNSVDFAFSVLGTYDICTSHSNSSGLFQWVWKDSIYTTSVLSPAQIEYSTNTGFFVSKKHVISLDWVLSVLSQALELKSHMVLMCMEQPFLNYLFVIRGVAYSSFTKIFFSTGDKNLLLECWAGNKRVKIKANKIYIKNRPNFFLLHWAGLTQGGLDRIPYRKLWLHYRNLNPKYSLSVPPASEKLLGLLNTLFMKIKMQ